MESFRSIIKLFRRPVTQQVMLGRWQTNKCSDKEYITVFNANRDHCGDTICGKTEEYKKTLEIVKSIRK